MNEKQPYEENFGEKLRNLPPPGGEERNWALMRQLLDRHMPRTGGSSGGGPGRWILGVAAVALVGSALYFAGRHLNNRPLPVSPLAQGTVSPGLEQKSPDQEAAGAGSSSASAGNQSLKAVPGSGAAADDSQALLAAVPSSAGKNIPLPGSHQDLASARDLTVKEAAGSTYIGKSRPSGNNTFIPKTKSIDSKSTQSGNSSSLSPAPEKSGNRIVPSAQSRSRPAREDATKPEKYSGRQGRAGNYSKGVDQTPTDRHKGLTPADLTDSHVQQSFHEEKIAAKNGERSEEASLAAATPPDRLPWGPPAEPSRLAGPAIREDYAKAPAATDINRNRLRRLLRIRDKELAAAERKAAPRIMGSGEHKNFVVGLTLPLAFPLNEQKPVGYNIAAGSNTAADYLPSPLLQYHLNDHVYVQTELQFASPQFVQPALLYQKKSELPPSYNYRYLTHSIFARKLYYFNLPVDIHYSPFKNFYLGTGLQFSSLLSGIAMEEDRAYERPWGGREDTLFNQRFYKFRNDSLSQRLNNAELRLLFDANYYWKRFTVGFRYNQALSNYIDIHLWPQAPYFMDRNRSLQFYLRYNIWEDHKKKNRNFSAAK